MTAPYDTSIHSIDDVNQASKTRVGSNTPYPAPHSIDKTSTKSTFGLTFQHNASYDQIAANGMISGQAIMNQKTINFLKDNPNYGFNSTSQRFSYLKEMQKMGETPGPGSYAGTTTQVSSTMNAPPGSIQKHALNTISSAGDKFLRSPSSRNNLPAGASTMAGSPGRLTGMPSRLN